MGTNLYAHIKSTYKPYDYDDPISRLYDSLDDDKKVEELENGYVWKNKYYKDIRDLNKEYYHILHIGKSSAGWHFSLCIYPLLGIKNLDDWKRLWGSGKCSIYTEYGDELSLEEALSYICNRPGFPHNSEEEQLKNNNRLYEEEGFGRWFNSYDEYMRFNGAKRGKNGLWAHNSPKYVTTDDTYDMTEDANFW